MKTYSEFRPTQFDFAGLGLPDRQNWLVAPTGRNRDSEICTRSNFRVMKQMLEEIDEEENDHEIHRFGHWGPGWFEIILIRPETPASKTAQEAEDALAYYPILSDDDYSELEAEEKACYWEQMNLKERIELCNQAGVSIFAARRDEIPNDVFDHITLD